VPYDHSLAKSLKKAGWRVKIHDLERLEPPHVTIYFKSRKWRLSLRTGVFLDSDDRWSQVDENVRKSIVGTRDWEKICAAWDEIHPDNPVRPKTESDVDGDDDQDE